MILRKIRERLAKSLRPGKATILYGPRRVGKTTLCNNITQELKGKLFTGTGDDATLRRILESQELQTILSNFRGYDLIFIDEAQKILEVGTSLKLLVDHLPETAILATGSSSFELAKQVGEPLTGRKTTFTLFPLSIGELISERGQMEVNARLENLLIYGSYPEVACAINNEERREYLRELRDAYLFKDILELENIRNSRKLLDLLTLLAFQIGQEVSLSELGNNLDLSTQTVGKYLDLLEKSFVIKNIRGFSRNLRKEVTKTSRYYFLDNGVRNAVINNFNPLSTRNDTGQLWENLMITERLKTQSYYKLYTNNYFWRTYDQQEVDLVEERDGKLHGFEFKFSSKKTRPPKDFLGAYPEASYEVIHQQNYLDFLVLTEKG